VQDKNKPCARIQIMSLFLVHWSTWYQTNTFYCRKVFLKNENKLVKKISFRTRKFVSISTKGAPTNMEDTVIIFRGVKFPDAHSDMTNLI
jgi:hypothetical protein